MRAPYRPLLIALAATSLLLACSKKPDSGASPAGSTSGAPTAASAATPSATSNAACDVVSCMNFMGAPDYAAGKMAPVPSVPPPPSSATLCGGSATLRSNYYTTTQAPEDIIAYYEKELTARGFTIKPHQPGVQPCSLMLSFHKEKLQIGNVSAFVGGFAILYSGK